MNSEIIMKSNVLDILFEKRNKLYGAYPLRKFYNYRLFKSLSITMGTVTVLCAFTFIPKQETLIVPEDSFTFKTFKQPKQPYAKKELPKQVKPAGVSKKIFAHPVIKADKLVQDTLQVIRQTDITGPVNIIALGNAMPGAADVPATLAGSGVANSVVPVVTAIVNGPINNPDVEPAYPGGMGALQKFLQRNLVNPTDMSEGELVAVDVNFVVGYNGKLQDFTIVKDGGKLYNNEVIRVLKKMPQWIPGKANGKNVAVYFNIPVKFIAAN